MPPEEIRHWTVETRGDLEMVFLRERIGRAGDGECADIVVIEALGVLVIHVGVAAADFHFKVDGDVVAGLPLGEALYVSRFELEREDGDGGCENVPCDESGVDVGAVCGSESWGFLGEEISYRRVVWRWFVGGAAEGEAGFDEVGGGDCDFDGHVGAGDEVGGLFADEDGGVAGEKEGIGGVVVGDDDANEGIHFEVT